MSSPPDPQRLLTLADGPAMPSRDDPGMGEVVAGMVLVLGALGLLAGMLAGVLWRVAVRAVRRSGQWCFGQLG